MVLMYDPPGGWKYGFPRPFEPKPEETLTETLIRDGYPLAEIAAGGARHVRFYEVKDVE